jgi:predicted  nucleic acid-binding Zn-ribbon protein
MALNEREVRYQSQIEEYQAQNDQSLLQIQNLQSELTKLQEEKTNIETQLNETINTLKHDHEKQYKELESEIDELNERGRLVHFFISLNFNFCFLRT